ncbi:MAG: tetratricopeptide repeat protein, partial [Methanoregulaceae archaeon]|nr:tetratricopeptide repeat protein [Methanoregulaceae archaeon]
DSHFHMGVCHDDLGRHREALTCYQRVLDLDPDDGRTWYARGTTLEKLGCYGEAMECFERALRSNPENQNARMARDLLLKQA